MLLFRVLNLLRLYVRDLKRIQIKVIFGLLLLLLLLQLLLHLELLFPLLILLFDKVLQIFLVLLLGELFGINIGLLDAQLSFQHVANFNDLLRDSEGQIDLIDEVLIEVLQHENSPQAAIAADGYLLQTTV